MIDPMTSLAFSVHSGKGIYALLLGSGISRASGIMTGWDIVINLLERVAAVQEEDCGDSPATWYAKKTGKEPDYAELLEAVAIESAERRQILSSYFEPTPEERERGAKQPTEAHKAIAALVKGGYIRVIVTTNFDRLMERALEEAGVVPSVIASADAAQGAVPLAHAPCTLIKVHGDYLDSRLKNTPSELSCYDEPMNRLLDRVFDDYGLIVCGWSADWDEALRAAIERCPNRRYTMFWSAYRGVAGKAKSLCEGRAAQIIDGMDADGFFTKLDEKVSALEELDSPHPLSTRMAVANTKQYLAEDRHRIRLHDLVMGEAGRVMDRLFPVNSPNQSAKSLQEYEAPLEPLLAMLATGGYWGRP